MELNKTKIGRVKSYDDIQGVGEIVDTTDIYLFTVDSLGGNKIEKGDLVKFRAEEVNDTKKAFFVNKISEDYVLKNGIIKGKIYNKKSV